MGVILSGMRGGRLDKHQTSEGFGNMEVWLRRARRAPRGVEAWLRGSLNAIKIRSPDGGSVETRDETLHRYGQFCYPQLFIFVDLYAALQPTLQVAFFARGDVQVNPKAVRANFEFLVAACVGRIGLEKSFYDVAVPELIAASVRFGIGKNVDIPITHPKAKIKCLRCPQQPHFCFAMRIGILALPIRIEAQRRSCFPGCGRWKSLRICRADELDGRNGVRGHGMFSFDVAIKSSLMPRACLREYAEIFSCRVGHSLYPAPDCARRHSLIQESENRCASIKFRSFSSAWRQHWRGQFRGGQA